MPGRPVAALPGLVLLTLLVGCGLLPREEDPAITVLPEPPAVSAGITYPVERVDLYDEVEVTAVVTPVRQTELYFTLTGRITGISVQEGDRVSAGAVLAGLDSGDLDYQLAQAEIDLEIARIRLDLSRVLKEPQHQTRIKELELRKQVLAVENLRDRVARTLLRAPHDGVVSSMRYEPGDTAPEYETVMEILDPSALDLQAKVAVDVFTRIQAGQRALVELGRGDWQPAAVARTVHRVVNDETLGRRDEYIVHLSLARPPAEALTLNGRLATRIIQSERLGTLAIPLAALRMFQDRTYVRVLAGDVRREVDVKVGLRTSTKVEILEGLTEGELVIGR